MSKETLILNSMHARALACGSHWQANLEGRPVAEQLVIALTRVRIEREEVESLTWQVDVVQRQEERMTALLAEKDLTRLEYAAIAEVERRHLQQLPQDRELLREAELRLRRMPVTYQQQFKFPGWQEYGADPSVALAPTPADAGAEAGA